MNSTHDIILIGAGCSSMQWLQLYTRRFPDHDRRILVIDRSDEPPARTWCFWTGNEHAFSHLVSHRWGKLSVATPWGSRTSEIKPFSYQYISGEDFFDAARSLINSDSRIERKTGIVTETVKTGELTYVHTPEGTFSAPVVYSSIPDFGKLNGHSPSLKNGIRQHFRGWYIETADPAFEPETATLMDFRTSQKGGSVFHYVLPFSPTRALVECTVFGSERWQEIDYDNRLQAYIGRHISRNYRIERTEQGSIPMSQIPFSLFSFDGTIPIGTAAGRVKPSTGYMFLRSLRHIERLIEGTREASAETDRFHFYDALLLGILRDEPERVARIMHRLFNRNEFPHVLRFLDESTSLPEDIRMFSTLPYGPFLKQLPDYLRTSKPAYEA